MGAGVLGPPAGEVLDAVDVAQLELFRRLLRGVHQIVLAPVEVETEHRAEAVVPYVGETGLDHGVDLAVHAGLARLDQRVEQVFGRGVVRSDLQAPLECRLGLVVPAVPGVDGGQPVEQGRVVLPRRTAEHGGQPFDGLLDVARMRGDVRHDVVELRAVGDLVPGLVVTQHDQRLIGTAKLVQQGGEVLGGTLRTVVGVDRLAVETFRGRVVTVQQLGAFGERERGVTDRHRRASALRYPLLLEPFRGDVARVEVDCPPDQVDRLAVLPVPGELAGLLLQASGVPDVLRHRDRRLPLRPPGCRAGAAPAGPARDEHRLRGLGRDAGERFRGGAVALGGNRGDGHATLQVRLHRDGRLDDDVAHSVRERAVRAPPRFDHGVDDMTEQTEGLAADDEFQQHQPCLWIVGRWCVREIRGQ